MTAPYRVKLYTIPLDPSENTDSDFEFDFEVEMPKKAKSKKNKRSKPLSARYYKKLRKEVIKEQRKREKGGNTNFVHHLEGEHRRSAYWRRSRTLILNVKKLEVQTHCKIFLKIEPTWINGKTYSYCSGKTVSVVEESSSEDIDSSSDDDEEEDQDSSSDDQDVEKEEEDDDDSDEDDESSDAGSPPKRRKGKQKTPYTQEAACRVCGKEDPTSTWIGCSYAPRKKKDVCTYWVHQQCVGLKYSDETEMKDVPFYCPTHI